MKIALVHDYIKEFGGAERVLEVLHEMYPDAPIYTAFYEKNSPAYARLRNAKIIQSWFGYIPFASRLASPFRFLTPFIWGSFDLSSYDVVISSASWYITKGFGKKSFGKAQDKPIEICYCHTPPRWLYGYSTSVNFQKYPLVRLYAKVISFFLRKYDYNQAQKVHTFVANSKEVQARIKKFYKRESTVIYPPISLPLTNSKQQIPNNKNKDYYFIVSRLVGGKGIELAIEAAKKMGITLKIAGSSTGYWKLSHQPLGISHQENIEFLGQVTDEELVHLYAGAKAFFALSKDEDFGITPVEAMLSGTAVIAYYGGGYKETVVEGKTGIFFREYTIDSLIQAIQKFEAMKIRSEDCIAQAKKFSKEQFEQKIKKIVAAYST